VRVALISPYSWTYPGGVTRHIEALACELSAAGGEVKGDTTTLEDLNVIAKLRADEE